MTRDDFAGLNSPGSEDIEALPGNALGQPRRASARFVPPRAATARSPPAYASVQLTLRRATFDRAWATNRFR